MNRKLVLVLAVILSGALLFPTVAAQFGSGDRVHQDLVLHPHSGPNGDYAMLDDNDELELNFGPSNPNVTGDGVNPDAVTPFDRVFNITYTGQQSAEVWLTSNVAGVSFYRGADTTASIEGRANNVTLGPGQTLEVGVVIDTTGGTVPSGDTFTLNARLAESPTTETTDVGTTTIQTTDEQTTDGETTDEQTTDVQTTDDTGGETTDDGDVQVQGGGGGDGDGDSTPTPTPAPTTEQDTGTEAGGTAGGGGVGTPGGGPIINVASASLSTGTASPGESVTVDATVENVGSADGTATVRLFANGDAVGTQEVTVPAGQSRSVSFSTSFGTVGEYDLRVEDVSAGTLLVQTQQGTTTTPSETTTVAPVTSADLAEEPSPTPSQSDGFPWLLVWLALLATAAVVTGYWTVQFTGEG